jgi:hypothetical protein
MELEAVLNAMDRAAANLAKLERVWDAAAPLLPDGPMLDYSNSEYDQLARTWKDLVEGLPPIDGWTVTEELPDIAAMGHAYLEYLEIGEPPTELAAWRDQPRRDLDEYRYRLRRARRRAVRARLAELVEYVELTLPNVLRDVDRKSQERVEGAVFDRLNAAIAEIDRLVGDTAERRGRWSDLHRHLHFGEGHDWHDIKEFDWPSIRTDIDTAGFDETEPVPVPKIDLGEAAGGHLTGAATVALPWERLDADGFERLLFDLLRSIPEHRNVQWLMQTRAPDRGRDLSLDRIHQDSTGTVRIERFMVQAKHWLSKSVGPTEVADTLARAKLWNPPARGLIIATSGRFTMDAVDLVEQHNSTGQAPFIELWPDNRLEALLSQKPFIAAAHGLR